MSELGHCLYVAVDRQGSHVGDSYGQKALGQGRHSLPRRLKKGGFILKQNCFEEETLCFN